MKFISVITLLASFLMTGCSWLYSEDGLIHDSSKDYLKAEQTKPLQVPDEYKTDHLGNIAPVPELPPQSQQLPAGDNLDKSPPLQVLAVGQGMRINRQSVNPGVFWMKPVDELRQQLEAFFEYKELSFIEENGLVKSDWVLIDNEAWWRSVFGTSLPRFERSKFTFSISQGERKGEAGVVVSQQAHQIMPYDEDSWKSIPENRKMATAFLNEFVGYMDYLERLENAKRLKQLNQGFNVVLGADSDSRAALLANTDWRTLWLKAPKVLEPFGFTLTDRDQSTGTYFFEFEPNEPGFFASLFGDDEGVALNLPEGAYQLIIGGKEGGSVTMTFIDIDGEPLSDAKLTQIYPHLSEAFGRNTRRNKYQ
jgi:outer membrane protein assembly factor BamC